MGDKIYMWGIIIIMACYVILILCISDYIVGDIGYMWGVNMVMA